MKIFKALPFATVAVVMSVSLASADESYFVCTEMIESGTIVDLGLVRAEADGVVEVYDYRLGERGDLLGQVDVNQGANEDVRVRTQTQVTGNVLAELKVNGETVASNVFPMCRD